MSNKTIYRSNGISFCGLLTIVFITLKLLDVIQWSWWWVLAPLWIPASIVMSVFMIIAVLCVWAESR